MYPKFLGIGAQKAGTTWLHAMLSSHEEIWLPHLKELHYFDRKFPIGQADAVPYLHPGRGIFARLVSKRLRRLNATKLKERLTMRRWTDLGWEFRYLMGDWTDDWYSSLFGAAHDRLPGEITPAYSCLSGPAISHVHRLMPDAKLILLLRDPIDRAWSHAKMDLQRAARRRIETIDASEYAAHFNSPSSRLRGDYLGTIRRWRAHFPESQFFLGFYDDIASNPENLLLSIFRFLGVSATERQIPRIVRKPINPGTPLPIPTELHRQLAALYVDDLRSLARQYGSYPQSWLEKCERVL